MDTIARDAHVLDMASTTRHSVAARLDRLPIGSFHWQVMWVIAFIYLFELGDLNNFGLVAPALRVQWNVSIAMIGYITSAGFIGMFVGAVCGGWFSDKVGRKLALILTTLWFSGFSLLNGLAWDAWSMLGIRFLTGIGLSSVTVVAMTYVSEVFPPGRRGSYQAWIMVIGLFGIPAAAYVSELLIPLSTLGWRLVFVFGGLGIFTVAFMPWMEESPRWLEESGRLVEADAAVDRIEAATRGKSATLPPIIDAAMAVSAPGAAQHGKFADLFIGGNLPRTGMLIAVWVFQTLGIFGFMAWVPTLLATHGFDLSKSLLFVTIMYLGAPVGALIAALISDRWERKYLITLAAVTIACFGMLYGLSNSMVPIIVFGFCVAMFLQVFAPLLYAYTPECYPTEVRSTGSGVAYGAGRLANGFGPLIVAFLFTTYGYKSVFLYIVAMWLMVALIVSASGPKTKGQSLT